MTGAASQAESLVFPGSQVLAGWWKSLEPYQPRALWIAHLFLHRVEALVRIRQSIRPDPIARLVLEALGERGAVSVEELHRSLHLPGGLLRQVLERLRAGGLSVMPATEQWRASAQGRDALRAGEFFRTALERRCFWFLDRDRRSPHFLSLRGQPCTPWTASDNWRFELDVLKKCLLQSADWKRRFGFPAEIEEIVVPGEGNLAAAPSLSDWHSVPTERPERLAVLLALGSEATGGLFGFAWQTDDWAVSFAPVLVLENDGTEVFSELGEEPAADLWRKGLFEAGVFRGLSSAEANACELSRQGHRLLIRASPRAAERLRSGRGALWVTAGQGRFRAAALVEVVKA